MSTEILQAFEQFKAANDERLKQIEAKGHADPLLEAKVDNANAHITKLEGELKARIDEAEAKFNRLGKSGGRSEEDQLATDHKAAYQKFIRNGKSEGLVDIEARSGFDVKNAIQTGSDPDGGFAVPVELDRNINSTLINMCAMRRLANVVTAGPGYFKLFNVHGTNSGWVGETSARPETNTSALKKLTPYFGEIYANPMASQNSLDDIFFDVESWIVQEVATEFEKQEGAFLTGDGLNKPKGLLSFSTATTSDATRAFGTIETIKTGDANGFATVSATASPFDILEDTVAALKAGYRNGSSWLMNKKTLALLRKVKTATTGEYVYQPPNGTAPGAIWGYSYDEDENMPDVGAGALPIAFGSFKRAYTIVDVMGTRIIRDPYTNKPYVGFYVTRRTGGMLENSEAIKFVLVSA